MQRQQQHKVIAGELLLGLMVSPALLGGALQIKVDMHDTEGQEFCDRRSKYKLAHALTILSA